VTHLTAVHALFLHFLLFMVIRLDHLAALKRASTWGRIRASLLMSRTLLASVAVVTHLTAVHALFLHFLLFLVNLLEKFLELFEIIGFLRTWYSNAAMLSAENREVVLVLVFLVLDLPDFLDFVGLLMSRTLLASVAVVTHLTAVHALRLRFLLFMVIRLDHLAGLKHAST
jgi:hypothetical protein